MDNEITDVAIIDNTHIVKSINYGSREIALIKNMYAKNATDDELNLLMYMSNKYDLDILTKEIFLVKYQNQAAMIFTSRDGHLAVAHKVRTLDNQPALDGMESGTKTGEDGKLVGWCKIYRKDMNNPFYIEVDFDEYSTGQALWKSKPKTMIQKVAESQCLRRAFHISGIYSEEEMGQWRMEMEKLPPVITTPPQITQQPPQQQVSPNSQYVVTDKFINAKKYWREYNFSIMDLDSHPETKTSKAGKPYCPEAINLYYFASGLMDKTEINNFYKTTTGKTKDFIFKDYIKMLSELFILHKNMFNEDMDIELPEDIESGFAEHEAKEKIDKALGRQA